MRSEIGHMIRECFVREGFEAESEMLFRLIRPSIAIETKRCPEVESRPTASRLCGLPGLPVGIEWPNSRGKPLEFLAQFNLEELSRFDEERLLPRSGMFFLFLQKDWDAAGLAEPHQVSLIHFDGDLDECGWRSPSTPAARKWWQIWSRSGPRQFGCDLQLAADYRLPQMESWLLDEVYASMTGADPESRYFDLANKFSFVDPDLPDPAHSMLGNPHFVQMDELTDYPPSSLPPPIGTTTARDWEALLQLTWDFQANVGWGDGFLTFWILREDLKARRFDRVIAQNVST